MTVSETLDHNAKTGGLFKAWAEFRRTLGLLGSAQVPIIPRDFARPPVRVR